MLRAEGATYPSTPLLLCGPENMGGKGRGKEGKGGEHKGKKRREGKHRFWKRILIDLAYVTQSPPHHTPIRPIYPTCFFFLPSPHHPPNPQFTYKAEAESKLNGL